MAGAFKLNSIILPINTFTSFLSRPQNEHTIAPDFAILLVDYKIKATKIHKTIFLKPTNFLYFDCTQKDCLNK